MTHVLVIGFHGVAREKETPARSRPILATDDGRVVVEGNEGDFEISDEIVPPGPLEGRAARIEPPIPARRSWIVLVLGPSDYALLQRSFDLADGTRVATRPVHECTAVYAEPSLAADLWSTLRGAIRAQLVEALPTGGQPLQSLAWRLQRVAVSDEDRKDALAALRRSGSPYWEQATVALYPGRPEIVAEIERRSERLSAAPSPYEGLKRRGQLPLRARSHPNPAKAKAA